MVTFFKLNVEKMNQKIQSIRINFDGYLQLLKHQSYSISNEDYLIVQFVYISSLSTNLIV